MKRTILLLCALLFGAFSVQAQEKAELTAIWERANNAYSTGNFDMAVSAYDSLLNAGYESAKVYYNLGNAYFKTSQIGKAILNYNKALLLSPGDEDIAYNLEIAESHTVDRIEQVPVFFLQRWLHSLKTSLGPNDWAVVSIVLFALMLAAVLVYLVSNRLSYRKLGFYGGLVLLVFFICSVMFASSLRQLKLHPQEAIIMNNAVPVKSSPDETSKDIFVLHEGTKVKVLGVVNGWREIMIADGNKGWLLSGSIELIR